jgi:hypothetical protein
VGLSGFANWRLDGTQFDQGSAIDLWIRHSPSETQTKLSEIVTDRGHIKIGVRVTKVGRREYRYDYAIMNFDFALASFAGEPPNQRLVESHGISAIEVPAAAGTRISTDDACIRPTRTSDGGMVLTFSTTCELRWGEMRSFSFVSHAKPDERVLRLRSGDGFAIEADILGPGTSQRRH